MHCYRRSTPLTLLIILFACQALQGQRHKGNDETFVATRGEVTIQIAALRDDVLRVRMWRGKNAPEDASWAVLAASRMSSVELNREPHGFKTQRLHVLVHEDLRLTVSDNLGNILEDDSSPVRWDEKGFVVRKTKDTDDHFFGLGDKAGPLDHAGEAFTLWNTDAFAWQETTDPLYKSIPFFLHVKHGRTVGLFLDNTFRSSFDFGRDNPDEYTIRASDGPVDYYLIYGPEPKQVVTTWSWLTGPTPLPPLWALGFQQSRYTYFPETQIRDVAARLRKDRIPTDVLWLDIDVQHKNWPFTIDQEAYPDFKGLVRDLGAEQFKLVVITDLHIAKQPQVGYLPYDSGVAGDHFMKNPDGSNYVGTVWPGASVFPDFTRASTRRWWGSLYKSLIDDGVAGFWNDMNEPAVFDSPGKTMPSTVQSRIDEPGFEKRVTTVSETHNILGLQNARATWDGVLSLKPNERPFVMTRASYAGGQRYGSTWTGDNSSSWNHLRQTIPQILNLGISGFALAGADVGGFAGSPSPDLLTKWVEIAAFQPIDRIHSAKGTRMHEVWVDGPEQENTRRRFIEERYRLMPYLYTVAEETSRDGLPINRPLFLEYPDDFNAGTEFLVGNRVLVAPSEALEDVAPYAVHLPPGAWYDYWTGDQILSGQPSGPVDMEQRDKVLAQKPLMITPALTELPVFVRAGSILPIAPLTQSTAEIPVGPLTLRVFPLKPGFDDASRSCSGDVYTDDGHSLDYRNGKFARVHFSCSMARDGKLTVNVGRQEGSWTPWWREYRIEVAGMSSRSVHAVIDEHAAVMTEVNGRWGLTFPAVASGSKIELQ